VIVSLQNGICEEDLGELFGEEMVIGCVVGFGATVHEPANLEMTSGGNFVIGKIGKKEPNHFNDVYEALSAVTGTQITDNIFGYLYSKLIINSCITTMGAISGVTLGTMLSRRKYRRIFIDLIREAVTVARAQDVVLEKYAGKINFYDFADKNSAMAKVKQHLLLSIVGFKYRKLKSSGLQSLETGRITETDYMNGYIAKKALENHVEVPINNFLITLIKEIEAGVRLISMQNFDQPIFRDISLTNYFKPYLNLKTIFSEAIRKKTGYLILKVAERA
jgi:2-dehydropantoate 2-reductase